MNLTKYFGLTPSSFYLYAVSKYLFFIEKSEEVSFSWIPVLSILCGMMELNAFSMESLQSLIKSSLIKSPSELEVSYVSLYLV